MDDPVLASRPVVGLFRATDPENFAATVSTNSIFTLEEVVVTGTAAEISKFTAPYDRPDAFDAYGVRVPAVIVSPYIATGTKVRASKTANGESRPFDHCNGAGAVSA